MYTIVTHCLAALERKPKAIKRERAAHSGRHVCGYALGVAARGMAVGAHGIMLKPKRRSFACLGTGNKAAHS